MKGLIYTVGCMTMYTIAVNVTPTTGGYELAACGLLLTFLALGELAES